MMCDHGQENDRDNEIGLPCLEAEGDFVESTGEGKDTKT